MSTAGQFNDFMRRSPTVKLLGVGILALILLIPASLVDNLIRERQQLRDQAVNEIGDQWGRAQRLAGPVIQVPYTQRELIDDRYVDRLAAAYFLPAEVSVESAVVPEQRRRGIYVAVLYTGELRVRGRFDTLALARLGVDAATLDWSRASLSFGVEDLRGIDSLTALQLGGRSFAFEPGLPQPSLLYSGFQAPIEIGPDWSGGEFDFALTLRGSGELAFSPLASQTEVSAQGNWGDPKFTGAFLPDTREVSAQDFSAQWTVVEVNRPLPRAGTLSPGTVGQAAFLTDAVKTNGVYTPTYVEYSPQMDPYATGTASATAGFSDYDFGVSLLLPLDDYRKTYRSARYSALFIAASFLTFFFIEVLNGRRLHLVQYLLIGAAVVLFYVLLLSLSEHIGFDAAYGLSALLILGMIGGYAWAVLDNRRLTLLVVALLALLYGFFYGLLQLEDYSLLIGSFGLLIALGTIMYLTRRTNWGMLPQNPNEEEHNPPLRRSGPPDLP